MKSPFSISEHIKVCNEIEKIGHPLNPHFVNFCWLGGSLNEQCRKKGVLARYHALNNCIEIPEYMKDAVFSDNKMLPTLIHELTHARQRQIFCRHSLLGLPIYCFLACPLWREITIEPLAETWEAVTRKELHLDGYETDED